MLCERIHVVIFSARTAVMDVDRSISKNIIADAKRTCGPGSSWALRLNGQANWIQLDSFSVDFRYLQNMLMASTHSASMS